MRQTFLRAKLRTILLLAASFAGCLVARSADAAVEIETATISPVTAMPGYTDQISIPQFDGSLGTLDSVTISLAGSGSFVQMFENTGPVPEPILISQQLQMGLQVLGQNGRQQLLSLSQNQTSEYRPTAFDGRLDFGGTSGGTYSYAVTVAGQATLVSAPDLAPFLGQGSANLYLSAQSTLLRVVAGDLGVVEENLLAGADITVTYDYRPIPEPVAWTTATLVLLGAAWTAQSRRPKRR